MRRYVEATSEYPETMQMYDSTVPPGTITTVHGLHTEYKCNHMLVTDSLHISREEYLHR